MFKTLGMARKDARTYREWFGFVGQTLTREGPRSIDDMAQTFCRGEGALDGSAATQADLPAVVGALVQSLHVFESNKLITGRNETRYTEGLRFPIHERVAVLTPKGAKAVTWPVWRVELMFLASLAGHLAQKVWKPFAGAVAVATTVVGVLKLFLLWRSEQAALAGVLAGVAVLFGHYWQGRT